MPKIEEIFGKFESDDDRESFFQAQMKLINDLTKERDDLSRQVKHLQEAVKKATAQPKVAQPENEKSYQEQICIEQLKLLNSKSQDNELTAEEARKVDIYTKLLIQIQGGTANKPKSAIEKMSTEDLLKLVNVSDDSEKH